MTEDGGQLSLRDSWHLSHSLIKRVKLLFGNCKDLLFKYSQG